MDVSDLSNLLLIFFVMVLIPFSQTSVESKKSQLVVRLFKPKRRIGAGHGAFER